MMMMKHYYHFYLMMSSSILGFLDGVSAEAPLSVSKKVVFGGSPLKQGVPIPKACEDLISDDAQACLSKVASLPEGSCKRAFQLGDCLTTAACFKCSHDDAVTFDAGTRSNLHEKFSTPACLSYVPPKSLDKPFCTPAFFNRTMLIIIGAIGGVILVVLIVLFLCCCCGCSFHNCCSCGRGRRSGRHGGSRRGSSRR